MIQITSLESRTKKSLRSPDNPTNKNFTWSDANVTNNPKNVIRCPIEWIQLLSTNSHFTESQSAIHEDMQLYNTSCKLYLITRFSLRPPKLMTIVDMAGKYYWWFNVSSKPLKDNVVLEFINEDIKKYAWIDAMKCQILLRKTVFHELILWIKMIENEENIEQVVNTPNR